MKLAVFLVVLIVVQYLGTSDAWLWRRRRRRRRCHAPKISNAAYVNRWDRPFTFSCSSGKSLTYIRSVYSTCHRDRVFGFGCARNPALRGGRVKCSWTGWVNSYDRPIRFRCKKNGFLTGVGSRHHNRYEDRQFKFRCCYSRRRNYYYKCRKTNHYVNGWRGVINYRTPRRYFLVGAISYHDNGQEDRRWKFSYCRPFRRFNCGRRGDSNGNIKA